MILEKRKQLFDEQTIYYITETESLCRRIIDKTMSQSEIVRNIIKGLNHLFLVISYIDIMNT